MLVAEHELCPAFHNHPGPGVCLSAGHGAEVLNKIGGPSHNRIICIHIEVTPVPSMR